MTSSNISSFNIFFEKQLISLFLYFVILRILQLRFQIFTLVVILGGGALSIGLGGGFGFTFG